MTRQRKEGHLGIRISAAQRERLGLAACLASGQRHEEVDESPLALEFINQGCDQMFERANARELAQARADLVERRRHEQERKTELAAQKKRASTDRRQHPERRLKAVGA